MINKELVTRENLERVSQKIIDLVLAKNADYGDAWQVHDVIGILVRLSDKALRLENIDGKIALVADECTRKTFEDMIGYIYLGYLLEEQRTK